MGRVGAVGIHLHDDGVPLREGPREAGAIGVAEAELAGRESRYTEVPYCGCADTSAPVPSGLPSSTTSTSAPSVDVWCRRASMVGRMVWASL
jgi:hypothetical protein